ncbi:MAG: KTSC domain-containing protein [Sphingobacteriales bacterium]|nr:MAG: KTSC domain-containing protein [Sphingobacteriales bacterium]
MPSSVILKYKYDETVKALELTFVSGSVYVYKDIPFAVFDRFRQALSKGIFFNKYIKTKFVFERIK